MASKLPQEETIEDRFGIVAVRKGYITEEQLVKAFESQVTENISDGIHRFVGGILIEQDVMTKLQVRDVLESMETTD
jgi:hypothetical protein